MRQFQGKNVFLTGAASGIGKRLAQRLAALGCHLYLVDINYDGLASLKAELDKHGVNVWIRQCDLSDLSTIEPMVEDAVAAARHFDLLINNAGVAYYGQTTNMTRAQWDWVMNINLLAPIRITQMLLPGLLARSDTHVVNMCSIAGLVAGGRFTAYHTSKFGLVGFTESLRAETGRHGIGVTAICPGPVLTELYASTASDRSDRRVPTPPRWISTTADRVAEITVAAIRRNRRQVLITPLAHALFQMKRFAPGLIDFANQFSRNKRKRQRALQERMLADSGQIPVNTVPGRVANGEPAGDSGSNRPAHQQRPAA